MPALFFTHTCYTSPRRCVVCGGEGDDDEGAVRPTPLGRIASFYYLQHSTMAQLSGAMGPGMDFMQMLQVG